MVDAPSPDASEPYIPSGQQQAPAPATGPPPAESSEPYGGPDPTYLTPRSLTQVGEDITGMTHAASEGIDAGIMPFSADAHAAMRATTGSVGAYLRGDQGAPGWKDR